MILVSIIIITAVLLVYADDRCLIKNGRRLSFTLVVIVFSLRYGYGNDYFSYQQYFTDIAKYSSFIETFHQHYGEEVGWMALNYMFRPFGFQFVILISTFALCYIYYHLINEYIPRPYRWIGVLLFLMYPNLFLLNLSMIRQGLAGALFLLSVCKGYQEKHLQSFLLCLVAVSLHMMAIVCIPFILLMNFKNYFNPRYVLLVVLSLFVFLILNPSFIANSFEQVMAHEFTSGYTSYLYLGGTESIGLGLFSRIVVIIPSLLWFKRLREFDKYLTLLFFIAAFSILLSTQNVLLLRLECFFLPFSVLIFPRLVCKGCVFDVRPRYYKIVRLLMVGASFGWILFSVRSFFNFFSEPTYAKAYATFNTVLSNIL